MQAMQPYETPWLEGASTLLAKDKTRQRLVAMVCQEAEHLPLAPEPWLTE